LHAMRYLESTHWATTPTVLLPRIWLFKQYEKELNYDDVLHFGKIFLCDSDNRHSHVITSCRRCVCTMEKKKLRGKKKYFSSINSQYAFVTLNWIKLASSWRKRKIDEFFRLISKWIEKEVNYDVFSYHEQKQAREKESLHDRQETYEAR